MKKILLCMILMASMFLCFAVGINTSASRGVTVNAMMGEFLNVSLDIITNNGAQGSPFDLMGSDVWPRVSNPAANVGRMIATWSVMTNTGNRTLTISATPLRLMVKNNSSGTYVPATEERIIEYRLAFELYGYSHLTGDMVTDSLIVYSGEVSTTTQGEESSIGKLDNWHEGINMPYVSTDRPVYILLMKGEGELYTAQEREDWSQGFYQATVTINITGGE